MKLILVWSALLCAGIVTGCGEKNRVDAKAVETIFTSSEPAARAAFEKAMSSFNSGDYNSAWVGLSNLSADEKTSDAQREALKPLLEKVRKLALAAPPKSVDNIPMVMPK